MSQQCRECNGTGRCQLCKGTGRRGYPGFGRLEDYRIQCTLCWGSGVCRKCHGAGGQATAHTGGFRTGK